MESNPLFRWVADRKVGTRILAVLALLALVAVAVGAVGLHSMATANAGTKRLYDDNVHGLIERGHVHQEQIKSRMLIANHAVSQTPEAMAGYE